MLITILIHINIRLTINNDYNVCIYIYIYNISYFMNKQSLLYTVNYYINIDMRFTINMLIIMYS